MRPRRYWRCSKTPSEITNGSTNMAKAISVSSSEAKAINKSTLTAWTRRIIFYIALLSLWELIARTGIWPDYVLPGPIAVSSTLVGGISNGTYIQGALVSLQRLAIGYAISLVIG